MLSGVILAGGKSLRLSGENKAFMLFGNELMIQRQIRELKRICDEVIIVTNEPKPFLPKVDPDVRIITDYIPQKGPLSGMHAGLSLARYREVWIVGCDMPYISSKAAEMMLRQKREGFEAVFPLVGGKLHPLHGIYDKSCVLQINELLELENTELPGLMQKIFWYEVPEAIFKEHGLDGRFTAAFKTQEQYLRMLRDMKGITL